MNQEELLQELSAKINSGEISREEITSRLGFTQLIQSRQENEEKIKKIPHFSFTKILYVLGVTIIVFGIIALVARIWNDMGPFGRILITLGLGLLTTTIGSILLLKQKPEEKLGMVFHFIGGILIPGGAVVTLYELGIDNDWTIAITFVGMFVFYLLLNIIHKHAILTFFAIANVTAAIYLIINAIISTTKGWYGDTYIIYRYLNMVIGSSYLFLAHAFRVKWNKNLIGALHFFGSTGFLGSAFLQVFNSVPWQLLYFLIVLCGLFLSAYMKSRSILIMSTIFLFVHVSYITNEYFADSLGWPISLIILGFIFIGLGYVSVTINKKYIKGATQ